MAAIVLVTILWLCDPISRFEVRENYVRLTNPLWPNGFSSEVELPSTASIEDVLQKYSQTNRDKSFRILEIKRVWLVGNRAPTWAARIQANSDMPIVLVHFEWQSGYWLVR